ncbi:MAG: type II 3-dehydroquinate dehydratase [bacterium]|nr:type II 3-dehydroquinate dehydratase [bacterium]
MKLAIINGPNLNLLGKREPEVYGKETFESYMNTLQKKYPNFQFIYFQSNIEGELINKIQELGFSYDGIILNAGAYTHTSIAIADAIAAIKTPVVEVHISNIFAREDFRHVSYLGAKCVGSISGFGLKSYELALQWFISAKST